MALPRSLGSPLPCRMILIMQSDTIFVVGTYYNLGKRKRRQEGRQKEQEENIVITREEKMEVSTKAAVAGTERREQT